MLNTQIKDPQAVLDYGYDWSTWMVTGDTIVASSWAADAGVNVTANTFDATTTTVWLSGGTVGEVYKVVNHITTSDGRQDDRTIYVKVKNR